MNKTCFKCKKSRPLQDFYKHPCMADGRLGKCKECTKRDVKLNFIKNREKIREYDKKRSGTAKRKKQKLEYQRERRKRQSVAYIKYKAHYTVRNAVKSGRLIRPCVCSGCGMNKRLEAHHEDYSKPLEVKWLCFVCHRKAHNQSPLSD